MATQRGFFEESLAGRIASKRIPTGNGLQADFGCAVCYSMAQVFVIHESVFDFGHFV